MTPQARSATWIGAAAIPLWATLAAVATATSRLPPLLTVSLAFGIAGIAALALGAAAGHPPHRSLRQPPGAFALGVTGFAGYHFLYFLAFHLAPGAAVRVNLINYLWPLLIVLFSQPWSTGRPRWNALAGGLAGFGGTGLLLAEGSGSGAGTSGGLLAAAAAAVTWAGYSVLNRRYRHVPSTSVAWNCVGTAAVTGLLHVATEAPARPDASETAAVLWMGLGPLGAAFFAWDHGCKHGDLGVLGAVAYATPLLSTLLLAVASRQVPSGTVWMGGALIVAGAVVAARTPAKGTSQAQPGATV